MSVSFVCFIKVLLIRPEFRLACMIFKIVANIESDED